MKIYTVDAVWPMTDISVHSKHLNKTSAEKDFDIAKNTITDTHCVITLSKKEYSFAKNKGIKCETKILKSEELDERH